MQPCILQVTAVFSPVADLIDLVNTAYLFYSFNCHLEKVSIVIRDECD